MSFTIWFTGLSGAGKSTLSARVFEELRRRGLEGELLDGDVIRRNLSQELTFSKEHRDIQVRRIGFICHLLNKHNVVSVAALISPYADARAANRELIDNFFEVYVKCPIDVLEKRDPKGLYARAKAGKIPNFTGISDPYEEPRDPDVVVSTHQESIEESFEKIIAAIEKKGWFSDSVSIGDIAENIEKQGCA